MTLRPRPAGAHRLLLNHIDAWTTAFIIATLAAGLHGALNARSIPVIAAIAVVYWYGFAVNDYFDAPEDAAQPDKNGSNFFAHRHVSPWLVLGAGMAVFGATLAVFARFNALLGMGYVLAGGFAVWSYSAPPLRLKARPGIDLLMHATFVQTWPYVVAVTILGLPWQPFDTAILTVFALTSLTAQLEQQQRDYASDRNHGRTFTTRVGLQTAAWLLRGATALLMVAGVWFLASGALPLYIAPIAVIALPVLLHRFLRPPGTGRSERLAMLTTVLALAYGIGLFGWLVLHGGA